MFAAGEQPRVRIDPATDPADFKPTGYMERVSMYVEQVTEPPSMRGIVEAVGGKRDYILDAIHHLVSDGYVETVPGPRGAVLHRSSRPYREAES